MLLIGFFVVIDIVVVLLRVARTEEVARRQLFAVAGDNYLSAPHDRRESVLGKYLRSFVENNEVKLYIDVDVLTDVERRHHEARFDVFDVIPVLGNSSFDGIIGLGLYLKIFARLAESLTCRDFERRSESVVKPARSRSDRREIRT